MLVSLVFSFNACKPGFEQHVKIRVVDEQYRPVPGVTVELRYQSQGHVKPATYFMLKKTTNSSGLVDFWVQNLEDDEKYLDCNLYVSLSYHGFVKNVTFSLKDFLYTFLVKVPFHKVTFRFFESGKPVNVKLVIDNDWVFENVSKVTVFLPKGKHSMAAFYNGMDRYLYFDVKEDRFVDVSFQQYKTTLVVVDDKGRPMDCVFTWNGQNVSFSGMTEFLTGEGNISGRLHCGNYTREVSLITGQKNVLHIDVSPPKIDVESVEVLEGIVYVKIDAIDLGLYSSGLKEVYVTDGKHRISPSYVSGKYLFEFPYENKTYYVYAVDKNGNTAFKRLEISEEEKVEEEQDEGGIPWLWIVFGLAGLGFAYWVYKVVT
jgi:hypothetical protein